jgi:hypothetical protein
MYECPWSFTALSFICLRISATAHELSPYKNRRFNIQPPLVSIHRSFHHLKIYEHIKFHELTLTDASFEFTSET